MVTRCKKHIRVLSSAKIGLDSVQEPLPENITLQLKISATAPAFTDLLPFIRAAGVHDGTE